MRPGDASLKRLVRSEFIKRELNTERLEVDVVHGIAYLTGEIRGSRARKVDDWHREMAIIETAINGLSGIRGVDNRVKCIDL